MKVKVNEKARKLIVSNILRGIPATIIAEDFGVSREYIRQIFNKDYGKSYKEAIKGIFPEKYVPRIDKLIKHRPIRYCLYCGKTFRRPYDTSLVYYCSRKCASSMFVREEFLRKSKICFVCGTVFMPYRNSKFVKRLAINRYFCDKDCYFSFYGYKGQLAIFLKSQRGESK